ncbi:MAG TPA: DAK2 domain-containing protein [Candidatus Limnocylindrales bacterium]
MTRHSCDGAGLLASFHAAVANLEAHVDEINALNVYPVPDGDTGANMVATVRSALAEAESAEDDSVERIAAAISFGALMGARGNSGVIASQIVRGMAEAMAGKRRFNGLDLAHALSTGTKTAYAAVGKPVEGTILTVIREASAAAVEAAERDNDLEAVVRAAVEAAEVAVARTPSLLPVLREAGVVDAGGQGLYRLMQGAYSYLRQGSEDVAAPVHAPADSPAAVPGPPASTLVPHADEGYGYETMFLVRPAPGGALDLDAIRAHLSQIGESVLVAGDARGAKIHVHGRRPDEALAYGLSIGRLSRISIENLDGQVERVRERPAVHVAGTGHGGESAPGEAPGAIAVPSASNGHHRSLAVVAVAAGDGLASVFESFGVAAIVRGGQGANPSTGELLAAIETIDADEILLLPNNPNVVLAARQVAEMTRRRVRVVPTRNAAEGVAALLALDPSADAGENAEPMLSAARATQTLQVTEAVRDAKIAGKRVKKGQTIVLDPDDGLVAVDSDREKALLRAVESFTPGFELVTLYYGDGADLSEAEAVAKLVATWRPELEVEVVHGGQPHYRYLIAAE